MLEDYFRIAVNGLRQRKLRAWLTIIGVVIGISSVVTLITVGVGFNTSLASQFEESGINFITVTGKGPGTPGTAGGLTDNDVDTLERISDFEYVTPGLRQMDVVEFQREKKIVAVNGWPADDAKALFESFGAEIEQGRWPHEGETGWVLLGNSLGDDFYDSPIRVNNKIEIKGEDFKVVGIMEKIGNPDDDTSTTIAFEDMKDLYSYDDDINYIMLVVKSGLDVDAAADKAERALDRARDDDDFDVATAAQFLEVFSTILSGVLIFLVLVALISLVVGGVGIMNSLYTSVLERTNEIGIMKSVGAENNTIMTLFLLEAGMIGGGGGLIGVIIGVAVAKAAEIGIKAGGFDFVSFPINWWVIGFALAFSVGVGLLSGYLPAKKASRMQPVESLRY